MKINKKKVKHSEVLKYIKDECKIMLPEEKISFLFDSFKILMRG